MSGEFSNHDLLDCCKVYSWIFGRIWWGLKEDEEDLQFEAATFTKQRHVFELRKKKTDLIWRPKQMDVRDIIPPEKGNLIFPNIWLFSILLYLLYEQNLELKFLMENEVISFSGGCT